MPLLGRPSPAYRSHLRLRRASGLPSSGSWSSGSRFSEVCRPHCWNSSPRNGPDAWAALLGRRLPSPSRPIPSQFAVGGPAASALNPAPPSRPFPMAFRSPRHQWSRSPRRGSRTRGPDLGGTGSRRSGDGVALGAFRSGPSRPLGTRSRVSRRRSTGPEPHSNGPGGS